MRKLVFLVFVIVGAGAGLLFSIKEDWGVRAVFMFFGVIAGAAVGGPVLGLGQRRRSSSPRADTLRGLGMTDEDLMDNYWRDEGHPQFMKPPSPDSKEFGGTGGMVD
ncbi:hypothetical protein P3W85_08880 [Cupriavidus basilensis]|uniref:Uncharacterized protein n=1 Tax=Cupriavidus basilensis TaxID=68895 RepID=A0ABT6AKC9_9BURK|nr:hypothetical protein [Cupriavidus basilensis]MDF3833061.1 hypothetical protein [Cupriavidus basilensis]